MSGHTKGQLYIDKPSDDLPHYLLDERGNEVAVVYRDDEGHNARRLLAAWNVCLNIPPARLESLAAAGGFVADKALMLNELLTVDADKDELIEALRNLSDATLAAAKCFNASGKGEGCDLTDWARARQKMHEARLRANALLAKHGKKVTA